MSEYHKTGKPGKHELLFLPLGGSGEIGMNLNLYGHHGKWLMVDYGITFGDVTTPGIDVIFPDPTFIEDRADDLVGLVLTHAHEDHLGAVPYLWDCFECPIHATPFTAAVLRKKLEESQFADAADIVEVPLSGQFNLGPFDLEFISLTHSIPEPNALIIRTDAGSVMHTGDWKLDPDPLLGPTADAARLIQAGKDGITAMVCDSTNALLPGRSGSEAAIRKNLVKIVAKTKGGVAIACFASNVARLESAAIAAQENGRAVCLVGRSLWRMVEAAKATGYLQEMPPFLKAEEVGDLAKEKLLYICTGSQGEPRAALARISRGDHRDVRFGKGDTVIFSSRVIPGNEIAINRVQNGLLENGVELITADDYEIHTSGHPNKDELAQMYQWIRPDVAIPVHGELRHMIGHAQLARNCQVPHGIVPRNGDLIKITSTGADVIDEVPSGRLVLDGNRITPVDSISLRERRKMGWGGMIFATVVVDAKGCLHDAPQISVEGLLEDHEKDEFAELTDIVEATVKNLDREARANDKKLSEAVRIALRRQINDICGKKPKAQVHLVRI